MENDNQCMYDITARSTTNARAPGSCKKTYYIFVRELFLKFDMCKACLKKWRVGVGG